MSKRGKSSRMNRDKRVNIAVSTQNRLVSILENTDDKLSELSKASARQLSTVSRKHRLSFPTKAKLLMCRKCNQPFKHGENIRTRITSGVKIVTCLSCENIRRYVLKPK